MRDFEDDLTDVEFLHLLNKQIESYKYYRVTKKARQLYKVNKITKRISYVSLTDVLSDDEANKKRVDSRFNPC